MPWQQGEPIINSPALIPDGPGDRVAGDVIAGRTPAAADLTAAGGLAGSSAQIGATVREAGVWLAIAAVALIGLWGLLSPSGGVAVIERAAK